MLSGEFAASPFTSERSRFLSAIPCNLFGKGSSANGQSWATQAVSGFGSNPLPPAHYRDSQVEAIVRNSALSKILEKIRLEQQHASVLPALGELRSTIRQFGSPFSSIVKHTNKYLNDIGKAKVKAGASEWFGKPKKYEKLIADTYLEYTFGLQPLIQDTFSIAEALGRWNAEATELNELPHPTNLTFQKTVWKEIRRELWAGVDSVINSASFFPARKKTVWVTKYGVRYEVFLEHTLQAAFGTNERLMQLLGFDYNQFLPTAWELLPWSWLADYFLNVQQIIEAGTTVTSHVAHVIKTTRIATVEDNKMHVRISPGGYVNFQYQDLTSGKGGPTYLGQWQGEIRTVTRVIDEALGVPDLVLTFPGSTRKLVNMATVLLARR